MHLSIRANFPFRKNNSAWANRVVIACLLILLSTFAPTTLHAEDEWQGVARIVAVGDVHGDFDNFLAVLKAANVVNRRGNWIAGETHLVQTGDVPDRGPDTDRVIKLLQKLESQASKAGGKVHALIGNHEAMNMLGDLRYVHPGEYAALRTRDSRRLRDDFFARDIQQRLANFPEFVPDAEFRAQWDLEVPLGWVEHRIAWNPQGKFGSWVLKHNAIIKINRILFLHAGISSEFLGQNITTLNNQIRTELSSDASDTRGISEAESGPLWYRGLAMNTEDSELSLVEQILTTYDVDHIVIGHTPGLGTIVPRFSGKVINIDSGISAFYGGHQASLIIEDGKFTTLQRGVSIEIPIEQADTSEYFKKVSEFGSDAGALRERAATTVID